MKSLKCHNQELALHDYDEIAGLQSCAAGSGLQLLCVVDRDVKRPGFQNVKVRLDR